MTKLKKEFYLLCYALFLFSTTKVRKYKQKYSY